MFARSQGPSPEEFWKQVEEERGESIIKYSLSQYIGGWEDVTGPRWGLVFVTGSAFCFRTFAQHNWFSSLLTGFRNTANNEDMELCISRAQISRAEYNQSASLLKKIFAPEPPTVRIACRDDYQRDCTVVFQIDPGAKEFAEILSTPV